MDGGWWMRVSWKVYSKVCLGRVVELGVKKKENKKMGWVFSVLYVD